MPSTYDVLGLIIGVISLLTFAKHIKRLVHGVLPPARVKAVENTISEIRTLVDRLESQGNLAEGASQAWTEYRSRLAEFSRQIDGLWLEVTRWEALGIARFLQPFGSVEFVKLFGALKRMVDDCYGNLVRQHLDRTPSPSGLQMSTDTINMLRILNGATASSDRAVFECDGAPPNQGGLVQWASDTQETHRAPQMGETRLHVEADSPADGNPQSETEDEETTESNGSPGQPSIDASITTPDAAEEAEGGGTSDEAEEIIVDADQKAREQLHRMLQPRRGGGGGGGGGGGRGIRAVKGGPYSGAIRASGASIRPLM